MKRFCALILMLIFSAPALSQCKDGVCVLPPLTVKPSCDCTSCTCDPCNGCKDCKNCASCTARPDGREYSWEYRGSGLYFLRHKGRIVGQYAGGEYYPWNGKENLDPVKPPIDAPEKFKGITEELKRLCTSGVVKSKCCDRDKVSYRGREIHPGSIQDAFSGKLEDDSAKGYLVIITKDPDVRKSILEDWNALPTGFISRYNVWMAPPSHFSMQDRFAGKPRFYTEGDPTIVLQKANGEVLFRRPQAGQVYKSSDLQALLKSDPSYKPQLDPGAPQPASPRFTVSTQVATAATLAGAVLVFFLLRRKK